MTYTLETLISTISDIYTHQDNYEMSKHLVDFHAPDGTYIGDYFNLFIHERMVNQAPKMYHIWGPYDLVSKKAPQRATVYQNGVLLINQDITHEINVRTAAMNLVVLSALWIRDLSDKKILLYWSGNLWKEFLKLLKEYDWSVTTMSYSNTKGPNMEFEALGASIGVACTYFTWDSLHQYDLVVLLTNSRNPVITKEMFATIKKTAIVTSFIGSQPQGELESSIYNKEVQIVVDRDQTLVYAKDLSAQIENGNVSKDSILTIEDLLQGKKTNPGSIIIYRSTWAPMQSLAIVKLLW